MTGRHSKGHWRCEDCGEWCACSDTPAAALRHVPCGQAPGVAEGWEHYVDAPNASEERPAMYERERIMATYRATDRSLHRRDTMVGE